MISIDPSIINISGCSAPFSGTVLLGIRESELESSASLWMELNFRGDGIPIKEIQCYQSDTPSFPDHAKVSNERPVLMVAAVARHWKNMRDNEAAFLRSVLQGDFELGGNFPRYRQHLEWFLQRGKLLHIPEDLKDTIPNEIAVPGPVDVVSPDANGSISIEAFKQV